MALAAISLALLGSQNELTMLTVLTQILNPSFRESVATKARPQPPQLNPALPDFNRFLLSMIVQTDYCACVIAHRPRHSMQYPVEWAEPPRERHSQPLEQARWRRLRLKNTAPTSRVSAQPIINLKSTQEHSHTPSSVIAADGKINDAWPTAVTIAPGNRKWCGQTTRTSISV
jgi:hypothetical protein